MTRSAEHVDASVVVPANNAAATLAACLHALFIQVVDSGLRYEIIVVDDASHDGTASIAEAAARGAPVPVRVIAEGRLGKSGARNRGVQEARGAIVLFTDADCVPTPDWLKTMVAPFADPAVIGLKGAYWSRQEEPVARFIQVEHEERYERMAREPQIDFIDTYSAAYRRDTFLQNGGFDPLLTFSMVEDQELSFRLAAAGHKLVFVPQARVYHRHLTSPWQYARRKFAIASWKALIVRRHPARLVRDSRTPQMLKVQMALAPLLAAVAFAGVVWRPARAATGIFAALFLATCAPFLRFSAARDPVATALAPLMLLIRALALSAGYAHGVIVRRRDATARAFLRRDAPEPLPAIDPEPIG